MKKLLALILALALMTCFAACSSKDEGADNTDDAGKPNTEDTGKDAGKDDDKDSGKDTDGKEEEIVWTEKDGALNYLDTEDSPFADSGLDITADTAAKTVNFVITDKEGNATVEYYKFDYTAMTMEKHTYVSAMGTGFYYIYDLNAGELTQVLSEDKEDTTESTKAAGRFESAAESTKTEVQQLEEYFSAKFGKTIADMAEGK